MASAQIQNTYESAINTINPRKAVGGLHRLFINYAKFFEEGGSASDPEDRAERDVEAARKVFEKAIKVNFKRVDDLAEVWCEWAEMEVRNENYDEAIKVMQRATNMSSYDKRKLNAIAYHDDNLSAQQRLIKSLKLWSFYVDLEESIGSVETTKLVYDRIFELKIANAQTVINYANFLEENQYFEESFKIYERGISLFGYPIAFELWNIFLIKFTKRYGGTKIERTRDLFEQALEECPPKYAKPLYLMYGTFEEEHGLARRAMNIYRRATEAVEPQDRFEVRTFIMCFFPSKAANVCSFVFRCMKFLLPKRRVTLVCPLLELSTRKPSKCYQISRLQKCVCASRLWSVNWAKSIEQELFMHMARNC